MDNFMNDDWSSSYGQDQEQFQSRKTSYFDIDSEVYSYSDMLLDCQEKNNVDTADSYSVETSNFELKEEESNKQGQFKYTVRESNKIEVTSKKNKNQYILCKKGKKQETKELTINFKTLIQSIFNEKQIWQQLDEEDKEMIKLFDTADSNLSSFRKFFGVEEHLVQADDREELHLLIGKNADHIRKICMEKLGSKQFIQKVLISKKMIFPNKIISIKYLQALRKAPILPQHFFSWKQP